MLNAMTRLEKCSTRGTLYKYTEYDTRSCEYNLLNEDDITLKKFKRIQIEYHYGYEKLIYKLEGAGFKCKYTKPVSGANNKNMHMGYIYAVKKSK